jgi:twitching motility protein PilT
MEETRLGAILLENPLMRQEDIERCLEIQALTGGTRPLGEILVEEGVISRDMLDELLALQQSRREAQRGTRVLVPETGITAFVRSAMAHAATDLVMSEGRPVLIRTGGQLRELTQQPLSARELYDFLAQRVGAEFLGTLATQKSLTREFREPGLARGRLSAFRHFDGLCVTIRLHPEATREAATSGMPQELVRAMGVAKGMVLITGEVRSGISETMTSLLQLAVQDHKRHVLVLSSDVEAPLPVCKAVVTRRQVGIDTPDYACGLRAAMAEAPDVIFVDDVSNTEAFDLALRAAEAGHFVVAAMRARGVAAVLERVLNGYPAYDVPRVRTTLAAVIHCIAALHLLPTAQREGSVMASEVLMLNDAAREIVRGGALPQLNLLMRLESAECGHSLDDSLIGLLETKSVRFEDAFGCAEDKTRLLQVAQKK